MGLQLVVSEKTDFRKDEKNRTAYTVTELFDFGRTGFIVGDYIENIRNQDNNSTVFVDGLEFKDAYNEMLNDLEDSKDLDEEIDNKNFELAFETLKKFVQENNILDIKDYNEREFEVYMSY